MAGLKIFLLLLMFAACIMLFIWVFRPGSAKEYEKLGAMPLNDENDDRASDDENNNKHQMDK